MFDTDAYFTSFQTEMRGYLQDLRHAIAELTAIARPMGTSRTMARELRRIGHTIAGLAKTLDLPDFIVLGAALDDVAAFYLMDRDSLPSALATPLAQLVTHLDVRLHAMADASHFLAPTQHETALAEEIALSLQAIAPPRDMHAVTYMHHGDQTNALTTEIVDYETVPAGEQPALEEDEPLSVEMQAAIDAFLHADLAHFTSPHEPARRDTLPPPSVDTMQEFINEMGDDLTLMRHWLITLQTAPQPLESLRVLGETVHKLKGAAAMVGMETITDITQMIESLLLTLRQQHMVIEAAALRWLLLAIDALDECRASILTTSTDTDQSELAEALERELLALRGMAETGTRTSQRTTKTNNPAADAQNTTPPAKNAGPLGTGRQPVRIDMHRIDQMLSMLNSMLINRIDIRQLQQQAAGSEEELAGVITRIKDLGDRLRAERGAALSLANQPFMPNQNQMSAPPKSPISRIFERRGDRNAPPPNESVAIELEQYSEFDFLMSMVSEVISDLRSLHLTLQTSLNQLRRQGEHDDFLGESLQRDLLNMRMMPFSELVPRLDLVVRASAFATNKEIEFRVEGVEYEIDRDISNMIIEPLIQLVRNAVVHGIELPESRRHAGKLEPARVTVRIGFVGDEMTIDVSDNGRGINHQQIIAAALLASETNGLTPERARTLTREEAFDLIFLHDVSIATKISTNSGRGMGLPTVKRAIEAARGTLTVTSDVGTGTTFHVRLPVTLGVMRALIVYSGKNGFALPLSSIQRTAQVTPEMIFQTPTGSHARIPDLIGGEHELPIITLPDLLEHTEIVTTGTSVIIIATHGVEYAIVVDTIGDERDIVVRKVPQHLRSRGVRGAAITTQGEVLLILALHEIVNAAIASGRFGARPSVISSPPKLPEQGDYILVVDDSPSIRRGLELGLKQAGYSVKLARDGMEAIEQITRSKPRLIILDVEMPQLNGYELLEVLHSHTPFQSLRAVMLTSRSNLRFREQAMNLGAIDYLVKPCTTDELVATIERALTLTTS